MLKKYLFIIYLFVLCSVMFSENYKIENVTYDLHGQTSEKSLAKKVPVNTTEIFNSEDELNKYLSDLQKQILNTRIFDSVSVEVTSIEDSTDYNKISILITTKDTWNFIALPYPSYDSNSGLKIRLKIKDYNFLGSMETFDCTANYFYNTSENSHDFDFSFDVPFPTFKILTFNGNFGMDFEIGYTIGDKTPNFKFGQSFGLSKKFNDYIEFNISLSNKFYIEPDYEKYNDIFYLKDSIGFSLPIKLATIENIGSLTWTPNFTFTTNWDFDIFSGVENGGIKNPDLFGPTISFGHSISTGRVNWDKNFRNGFSISASQNFNYNFYSNTLTPTFNFDSKIYKKFSDWVGLATNQSFFLNVNGNLSEKGGELRGIKNSYFNSSSGIILNFDLPIKIVQTDWVNFFNYFGLDWNWTRLFDFEFQLNPFIDMALCKNQFTGTQYLIEDGFYSCGFEMLVYPNKMKSITGRISLGVDAVKLLDKVGNKISFVEKVTDKIFNTSWRTGSIWELYIGIGLFY